MIFDMDDFAQLDGGMLVFPTFPYADPPKHPDDIGETIILTGSASGASTSVLGSADTVE